jgi:hypothetical protein
VLHKSKAASADAYPSGYLRHWEATDGTFDFSTVAQGMRGQEQALQLLRARVGIEYEQAVGLLEVSESYVGTTPHELCSTWPHRSWLDKGLVEL